MSIRNLLPIACLLATPLPAYAGEAVPAAAQHTIDAVHAAAARKDFAALQALMLQDFTWSFGGDGNAQQAIASWRTDPEATKALARVTGTRCARLAGTTIIECPAKAGIGWRAGFAQSPSGWRMTYFVAGD